MKFSISRILQLLLDTGRSPCADVKPTRSSSKKIHPPPQPTGLENRPTMLQQSKESRVRAVRRRTITRRRKERTKKLIDRSTYYRAGARDFRTSLSTVDELSLEDWTGQNNHSNNTRVRESMNSCDGVHRRNSVKNTLVRESMNSRGGVRRRSSVTRTSCKNSALDSNFGVDGQITI
jgi:hypothetical protein